MTTYSSILAGKIPWAEESGRVLRVAKSQTRLSTHTHTHTHTHPQNLVDNCHHNDGRRNNSWWEGGSMFQESNSGWGRKQPLLPTFRSTELQKVHKTSTPERAEEGDLACQLPVTRGHEHLKCDWCGWGTESLIEFNFNQVKSWSYIKFFLLITDLLFW